MGEEVEDNPFFKALQEQFNEIYEKAQDECCTICIPQAASLPRAKISANFVGMNRVLYRRRKFCDSQEGLPS
jgi:hypothetical protein